MGIQRKKQDGWGRRRHERSRSFCRLLGRDAHKSFRKNSDSPHLALEQSDCVALHQGLIALFAAIPNDWYRKNQMAGYEGFYTSIIYSCFYALGLKVIAEDVTNQGRIDLTVFSTDSVYIIEFKVLNEKDNTGRALAQIKAKHYPQKYAGSGKNVFLVGIEFDKAERNIVRFDWEAL